MPNGYPLGARRDITGGWSRLRFEDELAGRDGRRRPCSAARLSEGDRGQYVPFNEVSGSFVAVAVHGQWRRAC